MQGHFDKKKSSVIQKVSSGGPPCSSEAETGAKNRGSNTCNGKFLGGGGLGKTKSKSADPSVTEGEPEMKAKGRTVPSRMGEKRVLPKAETKM